jgi:hypothetical protein
MATPDSRTSLAQRTGAAIADPRGMPRAIHIEDQLLCSLPVPQSPCILFLLQGPGEQVFEKQRTQRLDWSLIQCCQKPAER